MSTTAAAHTRRFRPAFYLLIALSLIATLLPLEVFTPSASADEPDGTEESAPDDDVPDEQDPDGPDVVEGSQEELEGTDEGVARSDEAPPDGAEGDGSKEEDEAAPPDDLVTEADEEEMAEATVVEKGTIEVHTHGDRIGAGVGALNYADGVAGVTFKAEWGQQEEDSCTTDGDGACSLEVPVGEEVTVQLESAPEGWEAIDEITYGSDSSAANTQAPDTPHAMRTVIVPSGGDSVVLRGSGPTGTTPGRQPSAMEETGFLLRRSNPTLAPQCGIDVALLMDVSGSVRRAENFTGLTTYREGLIGFLASIEDTPNRVSTFRFGTRGEVVGTDGAPSTQVSDASWLAMDDEDDFAQAETRITNTYTLPPFGSPGQFPSPDQGTNYDDGFRIVNDALSGPLAGADLVVFVTDGNPTLISGGSSSDSSPSFVQLQDVLYGTSSANRVKENEDTRIVVVGAGDVTQSTLELVSGPITAGPAQQRDVFVGEFGDIGELLEEFAATLCTARVTVEKKVDDEPADDWEFEVDFDGEASSTRTTDGDGQFVVDFDLEDLDVSGFSLTEMQQPGFEVAETPVCDGIDYTVSEDGLTVTFDRNVVIGDNITCTFRNRPLPEAAIEVTKQVSVDGGSEAPADEVTVLAGSDVTWHITVENTGGTDLEDLEFADVLDPADPDVSAPCVEAAEVAFNDRGWGNNGSGGIFPAGQDFKFDCPSEEVSPGTTTNTFTATATAATDVTGDAEVSDSDFATVTGVEAGIDVTKQVSVDGGSEAPADDVTVLAGSDVTWHITVANTGGTDLKHLEFADVLDPADPYVSQACVAAAVGKLDGATLSANGGDISFTCSSEGVSTDTTNTFTASGVPDVGGAGDDDRVQDSDTAEVTVFDYHIGIDGPAENLTGFDHEFTITVTATGTTSFDGMDVVVATTTESTVGGFTDDGADCKLEATGDPSVKTCTVTVTSDDVGITAVEATLKFDGETVSTVGGLDCPSPQQDSGISQAVADRGVDYRFCEGPGVKFWVDYQLTGEEPAFNAVDDVHESVFTLVKVVPDVQMADGPATVDKPVGVAELNIALDGAGGFIEVDDAGEPVLDEDGAFVFLDPDDETTCTTDEDGECSVFYVSLEPGKTTVTASYEASDEEGNSRDIEEAESIKYWTDLELVKTAEPSSVVFGVGNQVVTYTLETTNVSDVPLGLTQLRDTFFDADGDESSIEDLTRALERALFDKYPSVEDEDPRLEPGDTVVVTFEYTVTSADAANGVIENTATVTGFDEGENQLEASDDATVVVTTPPPPPPSGDPGIGVVKIANPTEIVLEEGEDATAEVTYSYTVTNEGNRTLSSLTIDDDVLGDLTDALRDELGGSTLAVNGEVTFEVTQTVGVDDIGTLVNVATVTGTWLNQEVDATDDASVDISQVAGEVEERPEEPDEREEEEETTEEEATEEEVDVEEVEVLGETIERDEQLQRTGSDSVILLILAIALGVLGSTLLVVTRGRRTVRR